ncbi:MAG: universal stress protein [Polyangiaceae bacterium]|nr:universal stress protein [Polyangiaceae bacterium]
MTIVCGISFSMNSRAAADTAACLAERLRRPLALVHVVSELGAELEMAAGGPSHFERERRHLSAEVERLRSRGVVVDSYLLAGTVHLVLAETARTKAAGLIVISLSYGEAGGPRGLLHSFAERLVRESPVPVLAVQNPDPLLGWLRGERHLRALFGADPSVPEFSEAVRWLGELRKLGPCDVVATHVAPPSGKTAAHRDGQRGTPARDTEASDVARAGHAMNVKLAALPGDGTFETRSETAGDGVAEHLIRIAEREAFDLLVVGASHRSALSRLWHGSVSEKVLRLAPINVACIPAAVPALS